MTDPSPELRAGTPARLAAALADRYLIERELGAGGMATVYLAEDLKHHRKVAIKVLRPELAAALGPERFTQEIEIAARLQHPHILPVHDSGESGGFLYYVMPFVEGESLRERLTNRGELPIHDAVRLLAEVAEALAYAHGRGVVHRDIKPENIMLSGRHALVMDFGVAKAVSEASGRNRLTTAGVALGTPAYMAPEQASADPNLDQRVDIYALGVLGYELLSGRPPFSGGTPQQILAAQVTMAPEPVTARRPTVSPPLGAVIMRALEKRPADRWQTADEMLAQLEPLLTPSGGMTPTETRPVAAVAGPKPNRFAILIGGALLLLAALVALAFLTLRHRAPPTAALLRAAQVTRNAGIQELPVITPDGKSVVYAMVAPGDSLERIELRRSDGGAAVTLDSNAAPLSWSPGGDHLLVVTDRGLESVPALGGASELLVPKARFGAWSPDGKAIVYVSGDSVLARDAGGKSTLVTRALDPHSPAWSPDGKWIAFVSGNSEYLTDWNLATSSVWLAAERGGKPIQLTAPNAMALSPVWAPDSRRLLFVSNRNGTRDIYQLDLAGDGHPAGEPIQLTHGLNASMISLTPDGRTLAYSVATDHSNVWSIAIPATGWVSSRNAQEVTSDRERIESIAITHDGKWLLFDSDRSGIQQIFRRPLAGGEVQQITHDTVPAFTPSPSPDGEEVAYHTIAGGLRRVFAARTDGTGAPVPVSPGTDPDERSPKWSPGGQWISWMTQITSLVPATHIAVRTANGWGKPVTIARAGKLILGIWTGPASLFGVDPAGDFILASVNGGTDQVFPAPASYDTILTGGANAVSSGDGKTLFVDYTLDRPGHRRKGVLAFDLAIGRLREVLRFDDPLHRHRSNVNGMAEHGGRLYFTLENPESTVWVVPIAGLAK